jgi:hypothetical protein|uniref:Flagellar protein FliL n=1 Tax=Desulfobacca acetoxidans TaxID=60893 RepID=A0A7C5EMV0_9BACT
MKKAFFLLAALLLAGTAESGPDSPQTISAKMLAQEKTGENPSFPCPPVTLAPFYLIQEKAAKVWIERVIVSIEGEKTAKELNQPRVRNVLFEILLSEPEKSAWPAKMQAAMEQVLGKTAVHSVHLSQCFLLF